MAMASLPSSAYFSSGHGPIWDSVDPPGLKQDLIAAGFSNLSATGSGTQAIAVTILPPGENPISISPTSGGPNQTRYDTTNPVACIT